MTDPDIARIAARLTEAQRAAFEKAHAETERLCRELDITNADHIALWLEANRDAPDSYLAWRIIEAHESEVRRHLQEREG